MKNTRPFLLSVCCVLVTLWVTSGSVVAQSAASTLEAEAAPKTVNPRSRQRAAQGKGNVRRGVPRTFGVDPRWKDEAFPKHAVCYQNPEQIAAIYAESDSKNASPVTSFDRPTDGSLRIVATGHSFMAPGYRTLPYIAKAAGFRQQGLLTHVGGGITGSARYKWEQENGIFQFDRKPKPKLLSSIANAKWDAMMWGPYYNDRPEYYSCWIDFCLKYNPNMKFYMSDAWPQIEQLASIPQRDEQLTGEIVRRMHQEKRDNYRSIIDELNERYDDRVFVLPTSLAMVLAVEAYHRGELPGVEGIHRLLSGKERSLWRDRLGHLGRGMESLEGYVFYATLYGRSPELIGTTSNSIAKPGSYPGTELDQAFRKIAWQAVVRDPLSGVVDQDAVARRSSFAHRIGNGERLMSRLDLSRPVLG